MFLPFNLVKSLLKDGEYGRDETQESNWVLGRTDFTILFIFFLNISHRTDVSSAKRGILQKRLTFKIQQQRV